MIEGGIRNKSGQQIQPTVTIISVVFNAAGILKDFLQNTTSYRSPEIELIILDGSSTDGSINLLQTYDNQIDYWRSEPDQGIYDAMNRAIQYAKGKWLYFMGADDRLLSGFTKAVGMLKTPNTIYYGNAVVNGEVLGKPYNKYDLTKAEICHQSIFYPAELFKHYQYNTAYVVAADHHLNIRCFADKRYSWQYIDRLIVVYDTRGYSSTNKDVTFELDYNNIVQRHLGWWTYLRYRFRKYKHGRRLK